METVNCILCGSSSYKYVFDAFDLKISKRWFSIVMCDCGLVFTNPRPTKEDISNYYGNKYYSYKPYKHKRLKISSCSNPLKILDIGCGSGKWLYKQKILGHDCYGIEISKEASDIANQLGLNVYCRDIEDIKENVFKENFFDIIRMNHVFEHVYNPVSVLKKVNRILHPSGKILLKVPNFDALERLFFNNCYRSLDVPRHLYHFNIESLLKIIDKCNLIIKKADNQNFPSCSFSEVINFMKCQYSTLKLVNLDLRHKKSSPEIYHALEGVLKYSIFSYKLWSHRILRENNPKTMSTLYLHLMKKLPSVD